MCGIAGFVQAREPADRGRLQAMTDRLAHRGPNDHGHLLLASRGEGPPDVALGHRRLSILDLSEAGHQPMASGDRTSWVVYNGEIYNYVELRTELRALGHHFQSGSDTEVLLAAYAEWGEGCLSRFNGMWAFALWDQRRGHLFCARDRFGVKPLYYAWTGETFVFASEIKALLVHPAVARRPNAAVVYDYLALRLVDHTAETFYDGISRLPAAHCLTLRPGAAPVLRRYWDCPPRFTEDISAREEADAIARMRELVEDAVRLRLRSDVPVGTCLSGGLDSSSIVVTANRLMFSEHALDPALAGDRQRTFSACFEDPRSDERRFIDPVIAATGASSHRVFPDGDSMWRDLPALLDTMDEPFSSTSQYSQNRVFRLARENGVTVTLDGQGADEILAGYAGYHSAFVATLARRGQLATAAHEAASAVRMAGRGRGAAELALRTAYGLIPPALSTPIRTALSPYFSSRSPEGRSLQVLRPELRDRFADRREGWLAQRAAAMGDLPRKLYEDAFQFSLPCLLRYADRNSMASSIESRTPLLDYRIIEHVFALPLSMIMRDGWTKWVFRKAMDGALPREVQWRKDKMGFVTPEGEWLRAGQDRLREVLGGPLRSAEFLDERAIQRRLGPAGIDPSARYTDIFRWFLLELWMRKL